MCKRTRNHETLPDLELLIYIRRGVTADREEEPEEIRVTEHQRESKEETCAVYEPVPSTVTVPSPSWSWNILKL